MSDFHAAMAAANVFALWEAVDRNKFGAEPAHIWRWHPTMSALVDGAIAATSIENAERRVLVLNNPAFVGTHRDGATINLAVNLQVLMPGERARAHRHTMNALRFVLEGEGATTIVEGKPCAMLRGDMILTPGWTWHEHVHAGPSRCVWVDALDVPLAHHLRDAVFEPGPAHDVGTIAADPAFSAAGLAPVMRQAPVKHSPMFRYPWAQAVAALDAQSPAADGSRQVRYTNPVTGGPALATLDCYLLGLAPGCDTDAGRTNSNAVCVVVDGDGETRIDDQTIAWTRNDIFTLPHNRWISHRAMSPARLFQITDREVLRRLELLRDETRPAPR